MRGNPRLEAEGYRVRKTTVSMREDGTLLVKEAWQFTDEPGEWYGGKTWKVATTRKGFRDMGLRTIAEILAFMVKRGFDVDWVSDYRPDSLHWSGWTTA